ncbi:MAG TPA: SRPBCC family protein [Pontibacter sp.]
MKLLLKICLALAVVAALGLVGFSYFLPRQVVVRQSIRINASPDKVFPYINNPADWKRWSAWNKTYDPTLIYMYGGPLSGEGARQSWSGDKTGNWQMVFTQSTAPDSLSYELKQPGQTIVTKGTFTLEKTATGTQLTWQQLTPVEDNLLALYKGAWQHYKTEQQVQQGLQNLSTLLHDTSQTTAKK